jgi:hypothetical protein
LLAYENYDRSIPKGNVWLAQSNDEGKTWSKSVLVNDAGATGDTTQQKIMAAPNGEFAVAFYDRRLPCPATDPIATDIGKANTCIDTTIQFYNADGTPLGGNRRVTQESWDPNINPPQPGGLSSTTTTFIGDYFGGAMTSSGASAWAHLFFVSTSAALQAGAVPGGGREPPYQQQVYARVPAP